ncbi:Abnormal cell migration protein [Dirofilaria immitis]
MSLAYMSTIISSSPAVISETILVPSLSSLTLLSLPESRISSALSQIMTIVWMVRTTAVPLISCYILITPGNAVLSYEPQISYFDGSSYLDNCKSKLERHVTALSGLLISHQLYGTIPYNASKNCFLLITAPSGYRIRLRVLDFNVLGNAHNCDKDTLHVFDHEKPIDPQALRDANQEDTSPGPILGQFCGTIQNTSELAVSTENALTLWWHTDAELPFHHNGEGFRLLWSAFRKSNVAPCNAQREFTCKNQECIAAELACNRYPDCKDESDLIRELQIAHKCDFLTDDPLGSLTGLTLLLISMAAVSLSACLCICACICCKCMKTPDKACTTITTELPIERTSCCTATHTDGLQQPTSPRLHSSSLSIMPPLAGKKIPQKATHHFGTGPYQ